MKISIVVPAYNEGKRVIKTVRLILRFSQSPVIVVDDGSRTTDRQRLKRSFAHHPQVKLISHSANFGKGVAMRTGAETAWAHGAQAVIFIDADGQHHPMFLPQFEAALQDHSLVFGYRLLKENVPILRKWGNTLIGLLAKSLFGIKRHDLVCGFFGMTRQRYQQLRWQSAGYGVETELAALVGRLNLPFAEIKINTTYIRKSKQMSYLDAVWVLLHIPYWYFRKLKAESGP